MYWCDTCQCFVTDTAASAASAIEAKRLANRVAITSAHPAARHYAHLYGELAAAEQAEVDRLAPAQDWH